MQEERLTEDLVNRLLEAATPETFLAEDDAVIDRSLASGPCFDIRDGRTCGAEGYEPR